MDARSDVTPRVAEVEELKAVEEYIRKERAEVRPTRREIRPLPPNGVVQCERLERQIVEMAMDAGVLVGEPAESKAVVTSPFMVRRESGPPSSAARPASPTEAKGSVGRNTSRGVSPARSARGTKSSFSRAARFAPIAPTKETPGPGSYNTHDSDFTGNAAAVEETRRSPSAGGRRGSTPPPPPPPPVVDATPASSNRLDAAHRREKDLKRQIAALHRQMDELRSQSGSFQVQMRQQVKDKDAALARKTTQLEAARGKVSTMRRAFADVSASVEAMCAVVGGLEVDTITKRQLLAAKQAAHRLETATETASSVFAPHTDHPPAVAEASESKSFQEWSAMPPNARRGRVEDVGAAPEPTTPPVPSPPPPQQQQQQQPSQYLGRGFDVSAVGAFAKRAVAAELKREEDSKDAVRIRLEEESISRTVGPLAAAAGVTRRAVASGTILRRSASPREGVSVSPRGVGASPLSPAARRIRRAEQEEGLVRATPAESITLRRVDVGVTEMPRHLHKSPLAGIRFTVEQKMRYIFAFFATFGARDKDATFMRHTGFSRLMREAGLVPDIITPATTDLAFSREVASRAAGTQMGGVLGFDQFISALADVSSRAIRGADAAPDEAADQEALRSVLQRHILPLFDRLSYEPTFVYDVVRVGASRELEDFAQEFLSDEVIRFFNDNKGAFRNIFARFAMLEDPGKQPRGSALSIDALPPSSRTVVKMMQDRHSGWQEVQRQQRMMGRWAFGQFISTMKLAPGLLNRRDLANIFRQANRGLAQDEFPDALSYTEFVEFLALVAKNAYQHNETFPTLVDKLTFLVYDMSERGAPFMGEEQRLIRAVTRVIKERLTAAKTLQAAREEEAAQLARERMSATMDSVDVS
jgi:hypothetical protein